MSKFLRVRTRSGWETKPAADTEDNNLTPEEVDQTFLDVEVQQSPVGSAALELTTCPMRDGWTLADGPTGGEVLSLPNFNLSVAADSGTYYIHGFDIDDSGELYAIGYSTNDSLSAFRIHDASDGSNTLTEDLSPDAAGGFIDSSRFLRTRIPSSTDGRVYNVSTGASITDVTDAQVFPAPGQTVTNSDEGTWLQFSGALNTIVEHDLSDYSLVSSWDTGGVDAGFLARAPLMFSPDGATLVSFNSSAGRGYLVNKWDVDSKSLISSDVIAPSGEIQDTESADIDWERDEIYVVRADGVLEVRSLADPTTVNRELLSGTSGKHCVRLVAQGNIMVLGMTGGIRFYDLDENEVLPQIGNANVTYQRITVHPNDGSAYAWGDTDSQADVSDLIVRFSLPEFRPDLSSDSPHASFEYRYKYRHSGVPD